MAGAPSYQAFTGPDGFACDFLPYRRSNAYFRTFAATTPEDWTNNAALKNKADDTIRFVEVAASSRATWLPSVNGNNIEVLAGFLMRPGQYTKPTLAASPAYETRIDTTAGTVALWVGGASVASVALPASVWTSSSAFVDCWVRIHLQVVSGSGRWFGVKVWSTTEAEPVGYTLVDNPYIPGVMTAVISTDPPGIGSTGVAAVSACRWFSYGVSSVAPTPRLSSDAGYFDKWMKSAHTAAAPRIVTAEIFVPGQTSGAAQATAVLRVATEGYNSGNAWPFSNQTFPEGLMNWPSFTRELPDGIYGRQKFTVSDLVVANANGVRDDWLRVVSPKAVVSLRYGDPTWPWYDLAPLFTGVVNDITESADSVSTLRVNVIDAMERFNIPVATSLIPSGSTNAGKVKPTVVGTVFNVTPLLIDAAALIYSVGSSAITGVTEVRDRGVALTPTAFGTVESFSASADTLRFTVAHGRAVNAPVQFSGSVPSPLVAGVVYFVKTVPTSDTMTLAATVGGSTIDLTGADTVTVAASFPAADLLRTAAAHGLAAGNSFRLAGTVAGGLSTGTQYFALAAGLSSTDVKLSTTAGGSVVDVTAPDTKTVASVNIATDTLTMSSTHFWALDQSLVTEGPQPAPLTAPTVYYRGISAAGNAMKVRATAGGADIDITGAATGGSWSANQSGYTITKWLGATASTPAYVVDTAAATIQLTSNPAGQITCDVQGQTFGGTASDKAGVALRALVGQGDPVISTVIGSSTTFFRNVGIWLDAPAVLADQIDLLAVSCSSVWSTNRLGTVVATPQTEWASPSYTCTITPDDLRGQPALGAHRLPAHQYNGYRVGFKTNYTVQQDRDLAGSVSVLNRAIYAKPNVTMAWTGSVHPLTYLPWVPTATYPEVKTACVDGSAAQEVLYAHTEFQLGLFAATLSLKANWNALDQFQCGKRIKYKTTSYGFDNTTGTDCLVRAVTLNTEDGSAQLTLLASLPTLVPVVT